MKSFSIFVLAMVTALALTSLTSAHATVSLTPAAGAPATNVTVKATGFDASTVIDVYFDTTDVALTTSNAKGRVTATFQVPASTQPGRHWVTVVERRTDAAAQISYNVFVDWPQGGWGPSKRSFNPYENTVNTGNVSQLTRIWSKVLDGFGNSKIPIVYNNTIFVRGVDQVVRAFSLAGKLLWTATMPNAGINPLTPAAADDKVFFSDSNGNVIAYPYNCHTNGSTCTPAWTTNIGSAIAGGLTIRGGSLYAPAADGKVYVLKARNGAITGTVTTLSGAALTTWIALGTDGRGWVASGTQLNGTTNNTGGSFSLTFPGTLSAPAVASDEGFVTASDSFVRQSFGWATATGGSGCGIPPAPAYANGVVYAAGCTSLGAYDASTGAALWTITTPSVSEGLTYANGVLYTCIGNRASAYAASYGGRLWSGGGCSAAPIMVNGVLYVTYANLNAYTLDGAKTTLVPMGRPDPKKLRPTTVKTTAPIDPGE